VFHTLAYEEALGVNASNSDLDAVPDGEFSRRNDHFIFTDPFRLLLTSYLAASATEARYNVPRWRTLSNAYHHIWPVNRSATVPSDPRIVDYRDYQLSLPEEDEVAIEGSNNLAAATENSNGVLCLSDPARNRNLPRGLGTVTARATVASFTSSATAWSPDQTITLTESLSGGWYSVVGLAVEEPTVLAARLTFPRGNIYAGRKMRPGCLTTEAVGNVESQIFRGGLGLWGSFHTFELPTLQVYDTAAGARTPTLKLDLVYVGQTQPAL
jgi:hypothetical protein